MRARRRRVLCAQSIGSAARLIWQRIRGCGAVGGGAFKGRSAGSLAHASVLNLVFSRRGFTLCFVEVAGCSASFVRSEFAVNAVRLRPLKGHPASRRYALVCYMGKSDSSVDPTSMLE